MDYIFPHSVLTTSQNHAAMAPSEPRSTPPPPVPLPPPARRPSAPRSRSQPAQRVLLFSVSPRLLHITMMINFIVIIAVTTVLVITTIMEACLVAAVHLG